MSMWDTLWPWRALERLKTENRRYLVQHADDTIEIDALRAIVNSLKNEISTNRIRISLQKDEIMRLNDKLKVAIFRDPKTGKMVKRQEG